MKVRVVTVEGSPWFVATDVCAALGFNMSAGSSQWTSKLATDERQKWTLARFDAPISDIGASPGGRGPHRNALVNFISESGLYKLIMRSDKPQAAEFRDWVTRSVLPAIRKNGAYVAGEEKVASGEMSDDDPSGL
jgi:prophage antirepressor-like protein